MSEDLDVLVEQARLAAADLAAVANHAIALRTLRMEEARDDVDLAVISRQWTSYDHAGGLDRARQDLDFASVAQAEIGRISTSMRASEAGRNVAPATVEAELVGRLAELTAECERRAVALRS